MNIKTLLFLLSGLSLFGCTGEISGVSEETETGTKTGKEILDELGAKALDESDKAGRVLASIKPIQEEFARSESDMPELKDVEVSVDGDCVLRIINHANGEIETRVNLNQLDSNGFSLVPDNAAGEFPGVRVATIDQAALVEVYRNGALMTRDNELVIKLVDRSSVERITPVLLQMMMICKGTI